MGIREGLTLRQYIDERAGKAEEMKQRAKLYQAQARGLEAKTQLDLEEAARALQMRRQLIELYGSPDAKAAGGAPSAPGSEPGAGTSPTPLAQYGSPLRDMLTQYQREGADVSVEPPDRGPGPAPRPVQARAIGQRVSAAPAPRAPAPRAGVHQRTRVQGRAYGGAGADSWGGHARPPVSRQGRRGGSAAGDAA